MTSMTMNDSLSDGFRLEVVDFEASIKINTDELAGKPHAVAVPLPDGKTAQRHGIVTLARQEETTVRSTRFSLMLRPWLDLLTDIPSCAVYQNMTVPEIVKQAAREQGFTDITEKLGKTPAKREYVIQYNESTRDFLLRIMAEEGIFHYYLHDDQKHSLVLADSASGLTKIPDLVWRAANTPQTPDTVVWDLRLEKAGRVGAAQVDDYNYLTPATALTAKQGDGAPLYNVNGVGHHEQQDGSRIARRRLESLNMYTTVLRGKTLATTMTAGSVFKLSRSPLEDCNGSWAVIETSLTVDADGAVNMTFAAVPPDAVRPPLPNRPRVAGPATGVVCGPDGKEVHTDEYGRVKVLLHWDRQGKKDDTASCWLRVAQPWAGSGYGAFFLPRVGQEVLVDFIDGDPSRPLVAACLYNATNKPAWKLPDNASISGIMGRSTPDGDPGNEFSMDDSKDKERLFFHAQKLLDCLVEEERTAQIVGEGGDKLTLDKGTRQVLLKKGDDALDLEEGSRTAKITKGDDTLTLEEGSRSVEITKGSDALTLKGGSRTVDIAEGDDTLKIKGKRTLKIDGDYEIEIGGKLTVKAGGKVVLASQNDGVSLESKTAMGLKAGADFTAEAGTSMSLSGKSGVKAESKGSVDLSGTTISVKGKASAKMNSPATEVAADAMLTLKGGMVKIN